MNSYNGESALENPLFICTNRILTLAWGILYVITSIWTFFLMGTPISSYLAVINNISIKIIFSLYILLFLYGKQERTLCQSYRYSPLR